MRRKARPVAPKITRGLFVVEFDPRTTTDEDLSAQLAAANLAAKRIGKTAVDQLRWVVDFVRKDFTALRPEEITALGWDLRAFYLGRSFSTIQKQGPMPAEEVSALQQILRAGITKLTTHGSGEWIVQEWPVIRASRINPTAARRAQLNFFSISEDERSSIIAGIVDLIRKVGDRLHACDTCGEPLVVNKRRTFCSERCAQHARNQRRPPRRKT